MKEKSRTSFIHSARFGEVQVECLAGRLLFLDPPFSAILSRRTGSADNLVFLVGPPTTNPVAEIDNAIILSGGAQNNFITSDNRTIGQESMTFAAGFAATFARKVGPWPIRGRAN